MRLIRRTLPLLVLAAACSESKSSLEPTPLRQLTASEQQVSSSGNDFSFALFQKVAKDETGKNVFISPLSASMSVGMTLNGAAGSTFDGIRAALRFGSADAAQIDAGYLGLIGLLRGLDPSTTFQIANSVWYRNSFAFKQSFLDTTKKYFDAEAQGLDFANKPATLNAVNGWVNAKTNGKIPTILDDYGDEVMFLINAIYFKGAWQTKFDPAQTSNGTFFAADGSQQTVPFMHRPQHIKPLFLVGGSQQVSIAELPYGNGDYAMDIMLRQFDKSNADSIAANLTPESFNALLATLHEVDYALTMPKFTMSYERTLNDDLSALGMGVAFTDAAQFPGISAQGVKLSFVKQKTFVTVDEAGTEAGASTITGVVPVSLSEFRVDRPFVFVIRERKTNTILFMGKVVRLSS